MPVRDVKYSFQLKSENRRLPLPHKIVLGKSDIETESHVLLKLLAFLMFHRERIQIEPALHMDSIPFVPHIVQLDYELRPVLWVECGDCTATKLDKLAVKVPEAELWVMRKSAVDAGDLLRWMHKAGLRRNRYRVVALEETMFTEVLAGMQSRNEVFWVGSDFEQGTLQFDFNGLWFDGAFEVHVF